MAKKPDRYHVWLAVGDSVNQGSGLGSYTNKAIAISEAKKILGDTNFCVWDDWEKCSVYDSWKH